MDVYGIDIDVFLYESFKLELELLKNKYEINGKRFGSRVKQIIEIVTRYQPCISELTLDDLLELAELDLVVVEFYLWSKYNISVSPIVSAKDFHLSNLVMWKWTIYTKNNESIKYSIL